MLRLTIGLGGAILVKSTLYLQAGVIEMQNIYCS